MTQAQAEARSPNGEGLNKASEGLSADKGWGYKPTQQQDRLKQIEAEKLGKASAEIVSAYNARMRHFKQPDGGYANIPFNPKIIKITPDTSTPARRKTVEVENLIRYDKEFETGVFISKDGVELLRRKGKPDRVTFTVQELFRMQDATFTHNHPKGMSFSCDKHDSDIGNAFIWGFAEIRAVTNQFRYIASPINGAWPSLDKLEAAYLEAESYAQTVVKRMRANDEIDWAYQELEISHQIMLRLSKKLHFYYKREPS